jgi:hypothetical protein
MTALDEEEKRILGFVNVKRKELKILRLEWSTRLHSYAQEHSRFMLRRKKRGLRKGGDELVHSTKEWRKRIIKDHELYLLGECIAQGFGPTESEKLVNAWMASKPHRDQIENAAFEEAAVGAAVDGKDRFFTLLFGAERPILYAAHWTHQREKDGKWEITRYGFVGDNVDSPESLQILVTRKSGKITFGTKPASSDEIRLNAKRTDKASWVAAVERVEKENVRAKRPRLHKKSRIDSETNQGAFEFLVIQEETEPYELDVSATDTHNNKAEGSYK